MKAIETAYSGCLFRSRLEARWAVFFDELGLKWEYEPEGFELPSGRYLPDFFIRIPERRHLADQYPGAGYWVEIKGKAATSHETRLFSELTKLTGHTGYLMVDAPGISWPMRSSRGGGETVSTEVYDSVIETICPGFGRMRNPMYALWGAAFVDCRKRGIPQIEEVEAACLSARQARFEHGQVGAPGQWKRAP